MENKTISAQDLQFWLEGVLTGKIKGEEITSADAKRLERLSKRSVVLEDVTDVAKQVFELGMDGVHQNMQSLINSLDIMMMITKDKLDLTDEEIKEYAVKRNEKVEEYIKQKQEESKDNVVQMGSKIID